MVDSRFHASPGPVSLIGLLGEGAGGAGEIMIAGAAELATAGAADLALAAHRDYLTDLQATRAAVVVVAPELRDSVPPGTIAVVSERAHELFAEALDKLYPSDTRTALAGLENVEPALEGGVTLGPHVVTGRNVEIGRNTVVGANTVIGPGVTIGRNCVIGSNVTIECAHIGNGVVVHAGARVGCEGFGWLGLGTTNRKIPQLGRVIIQDLVEIGANTTIDRGALGDTLIGEGTKIDNQVQIGHNCRIGRYCLIAGQCGLSGSTVLEDGVLFGGGAGTGGHLTIGAGAIVRGRAGVTKDVPPDGDVFGVPAQPTRDFWREAATLRRLTRKEKR